MPSTTRQKKQSQRRQTWPRSELGCLETIIESPRTPQKARFPPRDTPDTTPESIKTSDGDLLERQLDTQTGDKESSNDTTRNQMIWYSHHLAESYRDRERLAGKIEQLESVCRYQSKTNASFLEDVRAWQNNYEAVESELIEVTQEIEEAKAHIRKVETSNANLRYALEQSREEQERARKRRWRGSLSRCRRGLQCFFQQLGNAMCGAPALKATSPDQEKPPRVVDVPVPSADRIHLLDSRSTSSQLTSQSPRLPQATLRQRRG